MTEIVIRKLKVARRGQLTIDIVVNLPSDRRHIGQLKYSRRGLYSVPQTHRTTASPIDIHDSYHPSGEAHGKLTRGVLKHFPSGVALGQAKPHTEDKEVILWQRTGQCWESLKGVERVALHPKGVQAFTNVEAMASGYPTYSSACGDYAFEIEAQSLPSKMVDLAVYLVEPENPQALENELSENTATPSAISGGHTTVEKAELFKNFNPWLAIVVFRKKDS